MIASSARRPSASSSGAGTVDPAPGLPLLSLGSNEVHLWLQPRNATPHSDAFRRQLLSRYATVAPGDWGFSSNPNGKPAIVAAPLPLQFNLSDSGDWLVCAVALDAPVGVDIEYRDPGRDVMKVARRCFSEAEISVLQSCGSVGQQRRFYDLWTLKEASIKARGGSLGRELEATAFELVIADGDPSTVGRISADSADRDYYCLLDTLQDYSLAVCRRGNTRLPPRLRLFNVAADGSEREVTVGLRACSPGDFDNR